MQTRGVNPAAEPEIPRRIAAHFKDAREFALEWERITAFLRKFDHLEKIKLVPKIKDA